MSADIADWTTGTEALLYQRCRACRAVWYFRRGFCPSCGATDVEALPSKGRGVVHAATLVCRPATAEARAYVPFMIVLVDLAEGFRAMAHGDRDLTIGDQVSLRSEKFIDRTVPYFGKNSA
jgi:uncharacterized OB-fold protein